MTNLLHVRQCAAMLQRRDTAASHWRVTGRCQARRKVGGAATRVALPKSESGACVASDSGL
jgi:hypothetical protein